MAGNKSAKMSANDLTHYQDQLNKDKEFTDAVHALGAAKEATSMLDAARTNPGAYGTVAMTMAKLIANQRITDTELRQFGGSQATMDQLK
jgi:hypothetical protein